MLSANEFIQTGKHPRLSASQPMASSTSPNNDDRNAEDDEVEDEDDNPLNISTSSTKQTIVFPSTMQMQREVFILTGPYISSKDAETFYEQAQRLPHLKINECMSRQAIEILHVKIMTESSSAPFLPSERKEQWQTFLDIKSVAKYILQFFSPNKRGNRTLKIPFYYSLTTDEDELATYLALTIFF
jgi:hypothetical protein